MEIKEYESKYLSDIFNINKTCHAKPQANVCLLEQIHQGQTWVALIDNKVVGFLVSLYREGPYIYNVAVLPEHRGKGIATALFNICNEFYKGQDYSYLYVDVNNPAQKLYFDLGYRVNNLKEDFYGRQQDALVMVKNFDSVQCTE